LTPPQLHRSSCGHRCARAASSPFTEREKRKQPADQRRLRVTGGRSSLSFQREKGGPRVQALEKQRRNRSDLLPTDPSAVVRPPVAARASPLRARATPLELHST